MTAALETGDERVHALALEDRVRIVVASTTVLVREAAAIHVGSPLSTVALGRLLTGAALLEATAKGMERLSLQVDGGGPIGALLARAYPDGRVCGTVRHPGRLPETEREGGWEVGDAVGRDGRLTVIRDMGFGEPWVGTVSLQNGEIGADLNAYLDQSEQVTSAVSVGVALDEAGGVRGAGGFLVQILGGLGPDEFEEVAARLEGLRQVATRVSVGDGADALLSGLGLRGLRVLERRALRYGSHTDRDYYRARLAGFDKVTLEELFGDRATLALQCEFTGVHHVFTRAELTTAGNA